jgi:hypothetical protein
MTEFNDEPLWVGMDVEAELARCAEEDRRREEAETVTPPPSKRSQLRQGMRAAIPSLGRGGVPRFPLAA